MMIGTTFSSQAHVLHSDFIERPDYSSSEGILVPGLKVYQQKSNGQGWIGTPENGPLRMVDIIPEVGLASTFHAEIPLFRQLQELQPPFPLDVKSQIEDHLAYNALPFPDLAQTENYTPIYEQSILPIQDSASNEKIVPADTFLLQDLTKTHNNFRRELIKLENENRGINNLAYDFLKDYIDNFRQYNQTHKMGMTFPEIGRRETFNLKSYYNEFKENINLNNELCLGFFEKEFKRSSKKLDILKIQQNEISQLIEKINREVLACKNDMETVRKLFGLGPIETDTQENIIFSLNSKNLSTSIQHLFSDDRLDDTLKGSCVTPTGRNIPIPNSSNLDDTAYNDIPLQSLETAEDSLNKLTLDLTALKEIVRENRIYESELRIVYSKLRDTYLKENKKSLKIRNAIENYQKDIKSDNVEFEKRIVLNHQLMNKWINDTLHALDLWFEKESIRVTKKIKAGAKELSEQVQRSEKFVAGLSSVPDTCEKMLNGNPSSTLQLRENGKENILKKQVKKVRREDKESTLEKNNGRNRTPLQPLVVN